MGHREPNPGTFPTAHSDGPLTSAQFHILLALAEGQRHGYGIMLEIQQRTGGALELGPGTLYRSIKQLLDRGLISEVGNGEDSASDPGRPRRFYSLTPTGRARATEEARRLQDLVHWAREATVLEGGR